MAKTDRKLVGAYFVESGVPIPDGPGRRPNKARYPWGALKAGDSFVVPFNDRVDGPKAKRARINVILCAGRNWSNNNGFPSRRYIARSVSRGIRVWRTA